MIDITNNVDVASLSAKKFNNVETSNLGDKQLKEVCNDFEAFFMQQMMDISLKSTNVAGEGTGADIFKGMYSETLSKQSTGSLGISDMLYNFLSENKR